jgi:hypothetical protein
VLRRPIATIGKRGIYETDFSDWGRGGRDGTMLKFWKNIIGMLDSGTVFKMLEDNYWNIGDWDKYDSVAE